MKVRKFRDEDLADIFEIYLSNRELAAFASKPVTDIDSFKELLLDEEITLCEVQGTIAGFISVYPQQSFVHHLYVHADFQRRGIGRTLVDSIRNKYEKPLSLKCECCNTEALSFYRKMGWKFFNSGSENDGTEYILLTLNFD